jgi:hypothetical protein
VRTSELQEFADLRSDLNGTLGALFMLEAEGHVHPVRGPRRQYIWHPQRRRDERPERLPALLPYERIPQLLRYFGRTPIGTKPIMLDIHLAHPGAEKRGQHERLLGALKILTALGIAAYDEEEAGWHHAGAKHERPYRRWRFGEPPGLRPPLPFIERIYSARS